MESRKDNWEFEYIETDLAIGTMPILYMYWNVPKEEDCTLESLHVHDQYEVHMNPYAEKTFVYVDGSTVELAQHQVLIISPHTPHYAMNITGLMWTFAYMPTENMKEFERYGLMFSETYRIVSEVSCVAMQRIVEETEEKKTGYQEVVRSQFATVMIDILRSLNTDPWHWKAHAFDHRNYLKFYFDRYFKSNHRWPHSKREIAGALNVSSRQLERMILENYGMTYTEKIQDIRFQKAKILLKDFRKRPSEVAEILGYNNLSSFSKAFKKYCGITASEYVKSDTNPKQSPF